MGLPHQFPHHGQNHLRRGINVIVRFDGVLAVVQVDLDGHHFTGLVAAMLQRPGALVVKFKYGFPGAFLIRGAR